MVICFSIAVNKMICEKVPALVTSGTVLKEIPGGHAKLNEISGSLKFHIHSIEKMSGKDNLY
jgi:hypothetical protein